MAEVSLRLLRSKAGQHLTGERILCGGKHGCLLMLPCMDSCQSYSTEASHRQRLYTLWTSGSHKDLAVHRQVEPRQEVRVYSQWSGSRAYNSQNGNRRNGAEGAGSPLHRSRTAYYDILGVTGNATQSQIKTAYYKQSFRFHPDRNAGNDDAARQFGEVTEAYYVLGSVSLRKKYDRGILSQEDVRSAKKPSGRSDSPSRKEASGQREASTSSSSRMPTKPMFDFDAFYQAHYGEQLAREQSWKARREEMEKKKKEEQKRMSNRFNKIADLPALMLIISAAILLLNLP